MTDIATWLADGLSAIAVVVACGAARWTRTQAVEARRQREIAAQQHHLDMDPSPEFERFEVTPVVKSMEFRTSVIVTVRQDCLAHVRLVSPEEQAGKEAPPHAAGLNDLILLQQGVRTMLWITSKRAPRVGWLVRLVLWPPGTARSVPSWRCGCGQPEQPPKPHWQRSTLVIF
jgi:hypothetical protein